LLLEDEDAAGLHSPGRPRFISPCHPPTTASRLRTPALGCQMSARCLPARRPIPWHVTGIRISVCPYHTRRPGADQTAASRATRPAMTRPGDADGYPRAGSRSARERSRPVREDQWRQRGPASAAVCAREQHLLMVSTTVIAKP
jgi:hypothetical protein